MTTAQTTPDISNDDVSTWPYITPIGDEMPPGGVYPQGFNPWIDGVSLTAWQTAP